LDTRSRLDISKFIKPMCEDVSFSYFDHGMIVATRLHIVNGENVVGDLQRADKLRRAASDRK